MEVKINLDRMNPIQLAQLYLIFVEDEDRESADLVRKTAIFLCGAKDFNSDVAYIKKAIDEVMS